MGEVIADLTASTAIGPGGHSFPTDPVASVRELRRHGRTLRATIRRRDHATLTLPERDPVATIEAQNAARLPELVPVRMGRMLQSPFAFYRGAAAVMAQDLAADAVTGHQVVCAGDAHLSNFGLFASSGRGVVFDLNDFDEASTAPWEWDVKRLAASIVVGGRDNGLADPRCRDIAEEAVRAYREALHDLFEMTTLERRHHRVETDWVERHAHDHVRFDRRATDRVRRRTAEQALERLAASEKGGLRIRDVPPVTRHVDYVSVERLIDAFERYRSTLPADTDLLLSQYTLVDFVLRVVGVGAVGTRCYVAMFVGPSLDPLFLEVKEALPSVLESHGGQPCRLGRLPPADHGREGHRVVAGQQILQARPDRFLGWVGSWYDERDGFPPTDFYVRQFRDMKGSLAIGGLSARQYRTYASTCARLLARAHSQSPGAATVAGYLGRSDRFDRAVARWSMAYADQAEQDFAALEGAVRRGRFPAEHGL